MKKLIVLAALGATLGLTAACGQQPDTKPAPAPEATEAPAEPTLATATDSVAYGCERNLTITAVYGTNKEGKSDVGLVFMGDSWNLEEVPTEIGRRFETEHGLDSLSGKGLVWLVDGKTAQLQEAPWREISDPKAATTLRTCKVKEDNEAPTNAAPTNEAPTNATPAPVPAK